MLKPDENPKPYRPSNGTEGDIFMGQFCFRCALWNGQEDAQGEPCEILGRTFWCNIGDKDYPTEWVEDSNGPRCTAFTPEGEEPNIRCKNTGDLFDEGA